MGDTIERFIEDFAPGQRFAEARPYTIDLAAAKAFAAEFDPQPFHLDEEAAATSVFHGLAISGWLTAAVTMRLIVLSGMKPAGGIVGAGIDDMRWLRPVRPNDALRVESEVVEVRAPKPGHHVGVLRVRSVTFNQSDEPVMSLVSTLRVPARAVTG